MLNNVKLDNSNMQYINYIIIIIYNEDIHLEDSKLQLGDKFWSKF